MATHPDLPLPLISVAGPPADWGAAYGAAANTMIEANIDLYRRRFADEAGLGAAAVRAAGAAFRSTTAALLPRIAAALDGVAEGAGVRIEDLYALNGRSELLYGGRGTPPLSPDGPDGGCTAVGVLGTHTARGRLLLGQNWDWHPDQRDAMVLLATRDERGHAVLTLAEAGMLAKAGVNSAGVGVCVNLLGCDRDGLPLDGAAPGVPYHVVLRAALEADGLTWALRAVLRLPRNASMNVLLAQAGSDPGDPAGGELIDLELVPGDAGWLHPRDGLLTHANHFETGLAVHDSIKDWGGSSLFRAARARRLLAEAARAGKVTDEDLAAVFRDHASFPHAICRHVDDRDTPADRSETVYSILLDPGARRFGIAAGPPCEHEYAWLDL
ncbi:MAG TPA: C45 family peptidase [Micromonosporaceae bacterium]|jgi:isopenicillin-N N-acyltransferase-like protein